MVETHHNSWSIYNRHTLIYTTWLLRLYTQKYINRNYNIYNIRKSYKNVQRTILMIPNTPRGWEHILCEIFELLRPLALARYVETYVVQDFQKKGGTAHTVCFFFNQLTVWTLYTEVVTTMGGSNIEKTDRLSIIITVRSTVRVCLFMLTFS